MNKLELIYSEGRWLILNGAGEIVYESYEYEGYADLPSGVEKAIVKEFGLDR